MRHPRRDPSPPLPAKRGAPSALRSPLSPREHRRWKRSQVLVFLANILVRVLKVANSNQETPHPLRTSAPSPLGEGRRLPPSPRGEGGGHAPPGEGSLRQRITTWVRLHRAALLYPLIQPAASMLSHVLPWAGMVRVTLASDWWFRGYFRGSPSRSRTRAFSTRPA